MPAAPCGVPTSGAPGAPLRAGRIARGAGCAEDLVHSRQGLGMAACNAAHQGPRTRRGTDLDVARVTAAAPLGDQAVALAALHQCNRRLVAGLQAFRSEARRVGKEWGSTF